MPTQPATNATAGIGSPQISAATVAGPMPVAAYTATWINGTTSANGPYTRRLRAQTDHDPGRNRRRVPNAASAASARPRAARSAASTAAGPPAIDRAASVSSGGDGTREIAGTPSSRSLSC